MDGKKVLEGPWECTPGVPTVIKFVEKVLEGYRYMHPWVPLRRRCQRQDAGVQIRRQNPRHVVGEPCRGLLLRHEANPLHPVPVDTVDHKEDGLHHWVRFPHQVVQEVRVGPHIHCRCQWPHHERKFHPHCSGDILVPDVGAVQGSDCTLRGGNVLSHVVAALVGHPEGHAPGGESRVVLGIDEPIPVHEHEQGSADMYYVRGAKEVPAAYFPPRPQVLGEHHQGGRLGGRPEHLKLDPGDISARHYPTDKV